MGRTAVRERCAVEFGARVRAIRENQGLSQEALGQLAHLSTPYISSVERGERNISLFNILRIASALGVDAGVVMTSLPPAPDHGRASRGSN
jgi:transcriptional regulator with XRE-family HTH domain